MLSGNQLTELRVGSFNQSLRNVYALYADYNQINGIEEQVLDELQTNLLLILSGNICTQGTFFDIPNNLPQAKTELSGCISNFRRDTIRCDYYGGTQGEEYFCILELHNPDGIEFESIEGEHQTGLTNNDVVFANAFYQNSRIIPSQICRQFPNLSSMMVVASQVEVIFTEAFQFCTNLEQVSITQNRIQLVWPLSFGSSPRLRTLDLSNNEISFIHQSAFRNTSIEQLQLSFNRLPTYNQVWCDDIKETITYLDLSFNQIVNLPNATFSDLQQLTTLMLASNPISNIPGDAFNGLTRLTDLGLSRTNIREMNVNWFTSLNALTDLYMIHNEIRVLPPAVFQPLNSLTRLSIYGNQIREVNRNSWGTGLANLEAIYLSDNMINFFDQQFLMDASSLDFLLLSGNLCVNEDFFNVQRTMWRVYEELRTCSDNFNLDPWLSCNYAADPTSYVCTMSVQNPRGVNFDLIEGNHVAGRNASDVTDVFGFYQNTMTIPPVVCETFTNLRSIYLWYSNVEEINEDSLRACVNLVELNLQFNWIREVPDFTFR